MGCAPLAPQGSWPATVKAGGFQSTAATATDRAAPEGPILAAERGLWGEVSGNQSPALTHINEYIEEICINL